MFEMIDFFILKYLVYDNYRFKSYLTEFYRYY